MAAIEPSQLYGYFYNILCIIHSVMEPKPHPLCAFVLVLTQFTENIDFVLWYIISFCLHGSVDVLLHIRRRVLPPLLICINVT